MQRCSECWSTVDADAPHCPQCGARLGASTTGRGRRFAAAGVCLVAILGGFLAWRALPTDPDVEPEEPPTAATGPAHPPTAASDTSPRERPPDHHWRLRRSEDGEPVFPLVIRSQAPERSLLLLEDRDLPLTGSLQSADQSVPLEVLNRDGIRGWVLLLGPGPPESIEPVELARLATRAPETLTLVPVTRSGERLAPVTAAARGSEGFELERTVPRWTVLVDASGAAVAISEGDQAARSLHGIVLWQDQRVGRPLATVQAELRSNDPGTLLAQALERLRGDRPTVADADTAIELCRRAAALTNDPATTERARRGLLTAMTARIRALSATDAAGAIAAARDALVEFPDDATSSAYLATLLARHGEPTAALLAYERLARISPDQAETLLADFIDELRSRARDDAESGRHAEATSTLASLVRRFPRRAELHHDYANQLALTDPLAALAEMREAAALDPAYAGAVAKLTRQVDGREVVIPFDPRTNAINTSISVAGVDVGFVVDTGASLTTIPTAVARRLGVMSPANERVTVQTASGTATGEVCRVPWIQIGSIRVADVRAVVIDLPGTLETRGLLGMNVLQQLDVQIDGQNGRLTLKER